MKTQELQQLSVEELEARLLEAERAYYELSENVMSGKEKDHSNLRQARRVIARMSTVLAEKRRKSA